MDRARLDAWCAHLVAESKPHVLEQAAARSRRRLTVIALFVACVLVLPLLPRLAGVARALGVEGAVLLVGIVAALRLPRALAGRGRARVTPAGGWVRAR